MSKKTTPLDQLSFRDVLHARRHIGYIGQMYEFAQTLGYPYFMWNDRIYKVGKAYFTDTGLTLDDVPGKDMANAEWPATVEHGLITNIGDATFDGDAALSDHDNLNSVLTTLQNVERWMSGYGTKTQSQMRQEVRAALEDAGALRA